MERRAKRLWVETDMLTTKHKSRGIQYTLSTSQFAVLSRSRFVFHSAYRTSKPPYHSPHGIPQNIPP